MTERYQYNCVDKSILLPLYKKYYVSFYFKLVPAWLTANFITIISTGFVATMMGISLWSGNTESPVQALLFAFCLHTYLLGDHLDGMQAKASGTSSPLGEFLDHYLDVYNGAIVFYTIMVFLGPFSKKVFLVLLVLNCIAFAATMVEELECRELTFGYLGTLEGVLLTIAFYISWSIPAARNWWQHDIFPGYPAYWIAITAMGVSYLGTAIDVFWRIGRLPKPFAVFLVCSAVLGGLLGFLPVSITFCWMILTLFSGDYIARVMRAYFLSNPHPYPDLLSSGSLFLVWVAIYNGVLTEPLYRLYFGILIVWLLIRVLYTFIGTLYTFRAHWYWTNP